MTCASCIHFTAKAAADASVEPVPNDTGPIGVCRRYPPRLTLRNDRFLASLFPNVHRGNRCGEHQIEAFVA